MLRRLTNWQRREEEPTKRFRANISAKSNEAATPTSVSKNSAERSPDNRPPPLEETAICKSTPWPKTGKMLGNLFEERKDWLLPPNNNAKGTASVTSPKPPIKEAPKTKEQPSTSPKTEKCGWGPNCPFCKNQEEEENWNGDHHRQLQQQPQQKVQMAQAKHPQTLNYEKPQSPQKFTQKTSDGMYPSQAEIHKQWVTEMERLKAKYNLDCFSDSELDSESDEGEQYKYEHGYKTLI